ncbi:AAA family ATPase [Neolewinella agarilytica]|nr:ATP-binding protein [Neolewinella agarilytica]
MKTLLTGRENEIETLKKALASDESEMVSVIGRRRVGKTFLIQSVYRERIAFEISGLQYAEKKDQLRNFHQQLRRAFPDRAELPVPKDWLDGFFQLTEALDATDDGKGKRVIFFDEVPWLATHKAKFLMGLSYFWNSWAVQRNVVVVICGSAASWMIRKVLRDKGGLHNRVTRRIRLNPFNLADTEAYLKARHVNMNRRQLMLLYMAMGGIPHYLKEVEAGESAAQAIDRICFSDDGLLRDEFQALYPALFDQSESHVKVIRALAKTQQGYDRQQLLSNSKVTDGGYLTRVLDELTESGFISTYPIYGKKKKGMRYRLTDQYSSFYLRFIEPNAYGGAGSFMALSQNQAYKSWCGYAFESVCLQHVPQIKEALRIGGLYTQSSTFYQGSTAAQEGAQIDLLLDRNDGVINLIETKFYDGPYRPDKRTLERLEQQRRVLQAATKSRKQLSWVLLAAEGGEQTVNSQGVIDHFLGGDDLFRRP